jgi:hypothetical protein
MNSGAITCWCISFGYDITVYYSFDAPRYINVSQNNEVLRANYQRHKQRQSLEGHNRG